MKYLIIVLTIAFLIFIVVQTYAMANSGNTEKQKYKVVKKEKEFEIRFYPSATLATVRSDAKTYKELANPGFRALAGYIFGGNDSGQKIPMTSPVQMDVNDSVSSMSFVMPEGYNPDNLPKPNNPGIEISRTPDEYVAAITFGGFASDDDLKKYSEKLDNLLKKHGIQVAGHYRYYGYNPPFQLFGRRNEIIVPVVWKE